MTINNLVKSLTVLCADWLEEKPQSKAQQIAKARFEGANSAANAMGYGMTPTNVFIVVMDWVVANPRPQAGSAMKVEYKAWSAKVDTDLVEIFVDRLA